MPDERMNHTFFISTVIRAAIISSIYFTARKEMLVNATNKIGQTSLRYHRSEHFQEETPTNYVEKVAIPSQIKNSARREAESCNSDTCCDSNFFCQNYNFVCVSCTECYHTSNGINKGCADRCAPSDNVRFPNLRWLSLSASKVDASRKRQHVDLRFAVQHDASGLLSAQVAPKDFS